MSAIKRLKEQLKTSSEGVGTTAGGTEVLNRLFKDGVSQPGPGGNKLPKKPNPEKGKQPSEKR